MSVDVNRCAVRIRAGAGRRELAESLGRGVRSSLGDALGAAFEARGESGVAIVPRMHVTIRAPLGRVRARDLVRAIATACAEAAATRSAMLGGSSTGADEGSGERILRAIRSLDGVRVERAGEAAAWLIALAKDERTILRTASPYADCERLPAGAAFAELCARSGDPAALVAALGPRWARALAERCSEAEALRILRLLADGHEPDAAVIRRAAAAFDETGGGRPAAVRALLAALELLQAGAADAGGFGMQAAGVASAALALARAERNRPDRAQAVPVEDAARASACAGFWLLLPHLTRRLGPIDDEIAKAIAFGIAEVLWGERAAADPAIAAFTGDERPGSLRARIPEDVRLGRLAVRILRDFVDALGLFRHARCTYVLRAVLSGPATVRKTHDGGWSATLPQSPLRILLERSSNAGDVAAPWSRPRLEIVRDAR